jgi:hypothetical protein
MNGTYRRTDRYYDVAGSVDDEFLTLVAEYKLRWRLKHDGEVTERNCSYKIFPFANKLPSNNSQVANNSPGTGAKPHSRLYQNTLSVAHSPSVSRKWSQQSTHMKTRQTRHCKMKKVKVLTTIKTLLRIATCATTNSEGQDLAVRMYAAV